MKTFLPIWELDKIDKLVDFSTLREYSIIIPKTNAYISDTLTKKILAQQSLIGEFF